MKKILLLIAIAIASLLPIGPSIMDAAPRTVDVQLPEFQVKMNGVNLDSAQLKYPLLIYKDITYIPMTWSISQASGLTTQWSDQEGLSVQLSAPPALKPQFEEGGSFHQGKTYKAQLPDFPITVNHTAIENAAEDHPLLVFQNVTYFPLTWKFAVDEFRWKLDWNNDDGVSIRTQQKTYMTGIMYDDDPYLYLGVNNSNPSRIMRIYKNLEGPAELLKVEEGNVISNARREASASSSFSPNSNTYTPDKRLTVRQHSLYFNDILLMNVEKYEDLNSKLPSASSNFLPLHRIYDFNEGVALVYISIQTGPRNPVNIPSDQFLFIVRNGNAERVEGFNQEFSSQSIQQTKDGMWIWTYSPTYLTAMSGGSRGQLIRINNDGQYWFWNQMLNAQYLRVLDHEDDRLLVQAYQLITYNQPAMISGYYRLHVDGTYDSLGELTGSPTLPTYVDQQKELYVVDRNTVTNIMTGNTRTWWDYELKEITAEIPNAGTW
ncbi:hypothetical protein [Paenibacillus sp. RC67]|uniref:hypothetical protein n=1 Tax=Paenibacillus sp. RC67 TaxID=3039392 RepID=UPI0024AE5055|nr:hypothetical protein [Paenibacillus sp. RC67]